MIAGRLRDKCVTLEMSITNATLFYSTEKERKARQLRRLRKLLTPKNAVVALHELQGPGMSEFSINTNGQETTAGIVVNNVRYEATDPNKHLVKARASGKALRDLIIVDPMLPRPSRMLRHRPPPPPQPTPPPTVATTA